MGEHAGDFPSEANPLEKLTDTVVRLLLRYPHTVALQAVNDLGLDAHHRIERVHRPLTDQRDPCQAELPHLLFGEGHHIDPVQQNLS